MTRKRHQVTVLLDPGEYRRFSDYCNARGFKKSTLVARLIRDHLDGEGFGLQTPLPFELARKDADS